MAKTSPVSERGFCGSCCSLAGIPSLWVWDGNLEQKGQREGALSLGVSDLCKRVIVADAVPALQGLQMPFASGFDGKHQLDDAGELGP